MKHLVPIVLMALGMVPSIQGADPLGDAERHAARDPAPPGRSQARAGTPTWGLEPFQRAQADGLGRAGAVAIGDVDADGRRDVLLATTSALTTGGGSYQLARYRQLPDGSLEAPHVLPYGQSATQVASISTLDLDGQHGLDVVVGGATGLTVFLSTSIGGLVARPVQPSREARSMAVFDLDQDGRRDLATISFGQAGNLHRNPGDGSLDTQQWPVFAGGNNISMAPADFNRDGRTDMAVSGDAMSPPIAVYLNVDGVLVGWRALQSACPDSNDTMYGLAAGDVNGDGIVDLVATGGGNQPRACLRVHFGGLDASFAAALILPSHDIPKTVRVADLNRDGRDDIAVLHDAHGRIGIYLQNADGVLAPEILFPLPSGNYGPHSLAIADFSGDGCPDVAIADGSNGVVTLKGAGCETNFRSGFENLE